MLSLARQIKDERVEVYSDGRNLGLAARLNQIADMCRTRVLVRMDADDIMVPGRLERQAAIFARDQAVDVAGATVIAIDETNEILGRYAATRSTSTPSERARAPIFSHPTVAGKASWFRANRYCADLRRAEDKELWLRTYESSTFYIDPEPNLFYRVPNSFNRRKVLDSCKADRAATMPYARKSLTWYERGKLAAEFRAKHLIYATVGARLWPRIQAKRVSPIADAAQWDHLIRVAISARVEGWE